jgi:hypothetical protein
MLSYKKNCLLIIVCTFFLGQVKAQTLPDLKPILDSQIGKSIIEIPKGKYLLNIQSYRTYRFNNLKDVTIKGNGSEIICNSQERAFAFYNCERVKFSDLSIDYNPLCFTQGAIVAMDAAAGWFEVEIDSTYPVENLSTSKVQFFDSITRELKRNSVTTYSGNYSALTRVGERRYRAVKNGTWSAGEKIGDLVVFNVVSNLPYPAPHTIFLQNCVNMQLENITVYGSNTFSFFEDNCRASHYNHCIVKRGNSSPGVPPRLRSGNADGINSNNASIGPLVENCEVFYNGDDCIIVSGRSFPICRVDETTQSIYLLSRTDNPLFEKGDTIQHVYYAGAKGSKMIVMAINSYTPTESEKNAVFEKYPALLSKNSYTKGFILQLNNILDTVAVGDLIYNAEHVGSGFVFRNNKVGNNRSRGLLIKGSNGLIENNEISNCAMQGILVSPEVNWMGGGYSDNILIKNNTIKECMYERTNTAMPPGALSVFCSTGNDKVALAGAFSNISIQENTVVDCPYPSIVYTSIKGVLYGENTVVLNSDIKREHGKKFGASFTTPVWQINNIADSALKVSLDKFSGKSIGEEVQLEWRTLTEINNSHFEVQRSSDGVHFQTIGNVQGSGNSTKPEEYEFIDKNPLVNVNYYRLKQVDFDGKASTSPIVAVKVSGGGSELSVYANKSKIQITIHSAINGTGVLSILDMSGRKLLQQKLELQKGVQTLNVEGSSLPKGMYVATLINPTETANCKFLK